MVTTLLVLSVLAQSQDSTMGDFQSMPSSSSSSSYSSSSSSASSTWTSDPEPPRPQPGTTRFRGALEVGALSMPSGTPGGSMDVFAVGLPVLAVESGPDFGFELGAELRLRVFDEPPLQTDRDYGHLLRRADWDEPSDFGQLLRHLRVGSEKDPVFVRAGRADLVTLGHGHLVSRYSNQGNPDYHPASGSATIAVGPVHTELFASDILAARLFAGEVALDIAQMFSPNETLWDRYHFAVSAAHDFGLAGYTSPPISLVHVDADATIYRNEHVRVAGFLGGGTRLFEQEPEVGAVAGFSASGDVVDKQGNPPPGGPVTIGGRIEARKQQGGFRQGMFGPAYELSRFSGVGFSQAPLAREQLPDGFSGYGELEVGYGPLESDVDAPPRVFTSIAAEYFLFGRLDGDVSITARFAHNRGTLTGRFTALDALGVAPRFQGSGEVRYRFTRALYVVATGGTIFFPQPDSTLVRGFFGSLGLGADFER